ncbi:MAG: helix-turn-helix transcriptional regulator [Burkholderiaceae bacterium]
MNKPPDTLSTVDELIVGLGEDLRAQRLQRNLTQQLLAERSGISVRALKNLESGHGATLRTLVSVLRALGRQDWLRSIAPVATINPLTMPDALSQRQRAAGKPRKKAR